MRRTWLTPAGRTGRTQASRRGVALLIVMVLLGLLSSLAVVFYMFASQERTNADYYAQAAKAEPAEVDVNTLMDFGLEQVIVGTRTYFKQSALWSSQYSMLSNMLGSTQHSPADYVLYNGSGVNVTGFNTGTGKWATSPFITYQQNNGMPLRLDWTTGQLLNPNGTQYSTISNSSEYNPLLFNWSPTARNGTELDTSLLPRRDVDYTYPDHNNLFLAYKGYIPNPTDSSTPLKVIVPSFHRPQLLRQSTGVPMNYYNQTSSAVAGSTPFTGQVTLPQDAWTTADGSVNPTVGPDSSKKLFRPHPSHRTISSSTSTTASSTRFLKDAEAATLFTDDGTAGFPFFPMADTYTRTTPAYLHGKQGVWSNLSPTNVPSGGNYTTEAQIYQYDVDNDYDGTRDGIWMDLDFPTMQSPNGKYFVPLFSFTIYDLDGLLNLNAHGNLAAVYNRDSASGPLSSLAAISGLSALNVSFASRSNQGLGPAEVNPQWGFTGRPGTDDQSPDYSVYTKTFGSAPISMIDAANKDWTMLVVGNGKDTTSGTTVTPGRYGEEQRMSQYLSGALGVADLPRAGFTGQDDNGDYLEGEQTGTLFGQPMDFTGMGSILNYTLASSAVAAMNPQLMQVYSGFPLYYLYSQSGVNTGFPLWQTAFGNNLMPAAYTVYRALVDDPYELRFFLDANDSSDDPISSQEMVGLHVNDGTTADQKVTDLSLRSRLWDLAPYNFDQKFNKRAQQIRERFTAISNDRKQFSWLRSADRYWEYTVEPQYNGQPTFPPAFGGIPRSTIGQSAIPMADPFRYPLRTLLEITDGWKQVGRIQRKLPIDQVLTTNAQGQIITQTLTQHVNGLASTVVSSGSQEYQARYDRQMMAKDIYVLLYTFCGPDGINPVATANCYHPIQCREMAQFAVNMVDAIDTDNVMTRFEYDISLADGWCCDDNPYTATATEVSTSQRAEVWGVERQDLSLSEGMFVKGKKSSAMTPVDCSFTNWNEATSDNFFAAIELRNHGPYAVDLNSGMYELIVVPTTANNALSFEAAITDPARASGFYGWVPPRLNDATYISTTPSIGSTAGTVDPSQIRRVRIGTAASGSQLSLTAYTGTAVIGGSTVTTSTTTSPRSDGVLKADVGGGSGSDWTQTNTYQLPYGTAYDFDVNVADKTLLYSGTDDPYGTPSSGLHLLDATTGADANVPYRVYLCRRANPGRNKPTSYTEDLDNPLVIIDVLGGPSNAGNGLQVKEIDTATKTSATDVATELTSKLISCFRPANSPLDRSQERETTTADTATGNYKHTIKQTTSSNAVNTANNGATLTIGPSTTPRLAVQRHPDRPFANIGEILNLPLYGPNEVSLWTGVAFSANSSAFHALPPYDSASTIAVADINSTGGAIPVASIRDLNTPRRRGGTTGSLLGLTLTAEGKILQPIYPTSRIPSELATYFMSGTGYAHNRWHRLFDLIEIPTRVNKNLVTTKNAMNRVPGRINPNTIRHPEVLAGWMDDSSMLSLNMTGSPLNQVAIADNVDTSRNWYQQFLYSRDASMNDPFYGMTGSAYSGVGLWAPGLPTANPFRSFSTLTDVSGSNAYANAGLFRPLRADVSTPADGAVQARHLFEVGTQTTHNNGAGGTLDPLLRNRILAKMAQNGTTRSNTFIAFVSVKFFRADISSGVTRIGGPLNGVASPEKRGVFVIDRTRIEKAYEPFKGFDFKQFIDYRRILQDD